MARLKLLINLLKGIESLELALDNLVPLKEYNIIKELKVSIIIF